MNLVFQCWLAAPYVSCCSAQKNEQTWETGYLWCLPATLLTVCCSLFCWLLVPFPLSAFNVGCNQIQVSWSRVFCCLGALFLWPCCKKLRRRQVTSNVFLVLCSQRSVCRSLTLLILRIFSFTCIWCRMHSRFPAVFLCIGAPLFLWPCCCCSLCFLILFNIQSCLRPEGSFCLNVSK